MKKSRVKKKAWRCFAEAERRGNPSPKITSRRTTIVWIELRVIGKNGV